MQQILVVDDEAGIRELLSEILRDEGYDVQLAENANQARILRNQARPDLVLLDIWMPDVDGITLLKEWNNAGLLTMPVVMMSGHGTIETAVEATRDGAYDFLEKPIALQKLLSTVGRALKNGDAPARPSALALRGRSVAVTQLRRHLERAAQNCAPLLLYGEPGSGVEQCARFVHGQSAVWVMPDNAAQLASAPLELLSRAREGTLFVPEISELNRAEQRGLRTLVERLDKYRARLICATTKPLLDAVTQGAFDSQLYAELARVSVNVPNLRERREDIPELATLLLQHSVEAKEVPLRHFTTAALNALRNHDWPGNLSQLESVVHTLAVTTMNEDIGATEVQELLAQFETPGPLGLSLDVPLRAARDAFERAYFEHHIARAGGNMSRVADNVGIERTHLYRKLKYLGIKPARRGEE